VNEELRLGIVRNNPPSFPSLPWCKIFLDRVFASVEPESLTEGNKENEENRLRAKWDLTFVSFGASWKD